MPLTRLWVTRGKVSHLSFVLASTSWSYFCTEVLAYYGERLQRSILAKKMRCLRRRHLRRRGERGDITFCLHTGMNVVGFLPVSTKLVLSSRNGGLREKISSFQFSLISHRFLEGEDKWNSVHMKWRLFTIKARWKKTLYFPVSPFTFHPNPIFSLMLQSLFHSPLLYSCILTSVDAHYLPCPSFNWEPYPSFSTLSNAPVKKSYVSGSLEENPSFDCFL